MKKNHVTYGLVVFIVFSCLAINGCRRKQALPDGMPTPHPTTITIIQDGKPLEGASIALLSFDSSNTWGAGGITDNMGKAVMKTRSKYNGVVQGKYRILITKRETDKSKFPPIPPDPQTDPEGYAKFMSESSKEKLNNYDLIDPVYSKISQKSEVIDVVSGPNEKTIDVGKAVRVKRK